MSESSALFTPWNVRDSIHWVNDAITSIKHLLIALQYSPPLSHKFVHISRQLGVSNSRLSEGVQTNIRWGTKTWQTCFFYYFDWLDRPNPCRRFSMQQEQPKLRLENDQSAIVYGSTIEMSYREMIVCWADTSALYHIFFIFQIVQYFVIRGQMGTQEVLIDLKKIFILRHAISYSYISEGIIFIRPKRHLRIYRICKLTEKLGLKYWKTFAKFHIFIHAIHSNGKHNKQYWQFHVFLWMR